MTPKIIVVGPDEVRSGSHLKRLDLEDYTIINTTSRSSEWSGLSPFLIGPCHLYGSRMSLNVENGWQYSKVYHEQRDHTDKHNPNAEWWEWSQKGFSNPKAVRYPYGKGAKPEYLYWDGEQLGISESRLRAYIPLYQKAVRGTEAFYQLRRLARREPLALWCFDGYYEPNLSWAQIITNKKRSMGHSFVLQMMLMISPFFDEEDLK